jgi:hypothetical protein
MTKVWAGASVGWAYLVSVIDCCTREIAIGVGKRVILAPALNEPRSKTTMVYWKYL